MSDKRVFQLQERMLIAKLQVVMNMVHVCIIK